MNPACYLIMDSHPLESINLLDIINQSDTALQHSWLITSQESPRNWRFFLLFFHHDLLSFKWLRCFFYFSLGAKGKSLKISSFKGACQNDKSGGRASGSKPLKNSARICYVPQESEHTLTESPVVTSEADETTPGSRAIQNLFGHWLTLLRTPSPNQAVDEAIEGPSTREISETQNGMQINKRGEIPRAVWGYFLAVDATIKIPLMIL